MFTYQNKKRIADEEYNANYIDNYIKTNFPDYILIDKKYQYLGNFSTYYDIDHDSFDEQVICSTTMRNNKTNLDITISFEHLKHKKYSISKYDSNSLKRKVNEFESFQIKLNDLEKQYNTDINVDKMELSIDYSYDIYQQYVYIRQNKNIDVDALAKEIYGELKKTQVIKFINIYYINDEYYDDYKSLKDHYLSLERVGENDEYDVIDVFYYEGFWYKNYYKKK